MSTVNVNEVGNICDDLDTLEHTPVVEVISYKELLGISDVENNQIPFQTEDELKQNVQISYNDMELNDLENPVSYQLNEPNLDSEENYLVDYYGKLEELGVNSNNLEQQVNTTNINTEVSPDAKVQLNYVEVIGDIIFDSSNNTITLKQTISKIIGNKPSIILTGTDLYSSNTLEGSYSKVTGFDVEWTGAQVYVGKSYSKTFKVSSTKFWITKSTTSTGWTGSYPKTEKSQTYSVLANKKAIIYPKVFNAHSKQYLPMPYKADIAIVPVDKRVPRELVPYRANYIKYYEKTYGIPKFNWSDYEVHHVVPLQYGGTHSMLNLFGLTIYIHQKVVHGNNGWWSNY
ncbi:hypothetical protein [Paenisporosarcina sp. NPDC076898]|uniref:hypothetical protein n=1 Tax=unclassified Paenisporosarcina TaxID=2642018 RepID=UPI003D043BDC